MPRPTLPPTPAPSTDIHGKDGSNIVQVDPAFTLPPSAVTSKQTVRLPTSPVSPRYAPISDQQLQQQRKRSSTHIDAPSFDGSIPPPPSRNRKIIHVEPREQSTKKTATVKHAPAGDCVDPSASGPPTTGRKKGHTTSAGRKIARKTAHSLIERRRRSKMNEEFGVLKDMIPACNGQDMHKLAILQASIEYVRYLKQCVNNLQSGQRESPSASSLRSSARDDTSEPTPRSAAADEVSEDDIDEDEEDEEQIEFKQPSYNVSALSSASVSATTSPAFSAQSSYRMFAQSDLPSPAIGPRDVEPYSIRHHSLSRLSALSPLNSTQVSPDLPPQSRGSNSEEEDASQALLMLNACDRRSSINDATPKKEWAPGGRPMSVQDLLR